MTIAATAQTDGLSFVRMFPDWVDGLPKAGRRVWKAIEDLFRCARQAKIKDKDVCRRARMGRRNVQKGWVQMEKTGHLIRDKDDGERVIILEHPFVEKTKGTPKVKDPAPRKTSCAKAAATMPVSREASAAWKAAPPAIKDELYSFDEQIREFGMAICSWDGEHPAWERIPGPVQRSGKASAELQQKMYDLRPWIRAWIAAGRPARE